MTNRILAIAAAMAATIGAAALCYDVAFAAPAQGPQAALAADDSATPPDAPPADDAMMLADDTPTPPPGPDGHPGVGMAPPGPPMMAGQMMGGPMMGGPMMGGMDWRHGGPHEPGRWGWHARRTFALFYNPEDKNLGTADVQKIAEAFLLMHGNHTWKVIDVSQQDDKIAFSFAAGDNAVIAKFTMDRHTGRIERTA